MLMAIFIIWTRRYWRLNLVILGAIVILSWFAGQVPGSLDVSWSPYQKLVVSKADRSSEQIGEYIVSVNNTNFQMIDDLRESHTQADPELYPPNMQGLSQYDIPLLLHPNPQSYLIVGAGAGNDAAGGLRHGVKEITAVEIDPAIIAIGRKSSQISSTLSLRLNSVQLYFMFPDSILDTFK